MRTWRFMLMSFIVACVAGWSLPALALSTPQAVLSLSSAGTPVGQTIIGPNGQPFLDANGNPLTVLSIQNTAAQATPFSLASMLMMPAGELLADANSVGLSLPMLASGIITQVTRSDGGVEHIFSFAMANGDTGVLLADQTGPNVYGIRLADVHPNGIGDVLTAHGLDGNFTNPPSYLSRTAKQDYWISTQVAEVFTPSAKPGNTALSRFARSIEARSSERRLAVYTSDYAVGSQRVVLSGSRDHKLMVAAHLHF